MALTGVIAQNTIKFKKTTNNSYTDSTRAIKTVISLRF